MGICFALKDGNLDLHSAALVGWLERVFPGRTRAGKRFVGHREKNYLA